MKRSRPLAALGLGAALLFAAGAACAAEPAPAPRWALVIHGGAGVQDPSRFTPEETAAYRADLTRALEAGRAVLAGGGPALDAAIAAVIILEDSPLFNAGRGAVFNDEGVNEMDAAVMDGATRRAGAVAGVTRTRNPVLAARAVMDTTRHVLVAGPAADRVAARAGLRQEPPHYFFTERRFAAFEAARKTNPRAGSVLGAGTVGAAALDTSGRLAAATSTGGLTYKLAGRVGDAPIIGAGTYADATCAASGTGQGEAFMRALATRSACAAVAAGASAEEAADRALADVVSLGGDGGMILVDAKGGIALRFTGDGMFRGSVASSAAPSVAIGR